MKDVHLFVLDTMADWEVGYAIAHINRPMPGVPSGYNVKTVGLDRTSIRSMGGLTIVPDVSLSEVSPSESAMMILPGSDLWGDESVSPALTLAKEFVSADVPVAAICGATFALAQAGILDDRQHTSNDPNWLGSSGYAGASRYVHEPAVDDNGVITASSASSLEFAKLILARLGIFSTEAREAWYSLQKTGEATYYVKLMEALEHDQAK